MPEYKQNKVKDEYRLSDEQIQSRLQNMPIITTNVSAFRTKNGKERICVETRIRQYYSPNYFKALNYDKKTGDEE